jgi:hypothetical protein
MTDRSRDSDPQGTQAELTSEELGAISGGMMSNEPTDVTREGVSGSGEVITTKSGTTDTTAENLIKATESYTNIMTSLNRLG